MPTSFKKQEIPEEEQITISTKVTLEHGRLIREAAELKGCRSVAQYVREVVLPWAASDLGGREAPVDFSQYRRHLVRSTRDLIAEAAHKAGLSTREFMKRAALESARRGLEHMARKSDPSLS